MGSRNGDNFCPLVSALTELFTCDGHRIPLPGLLPQGDHVGLLFLCFPKNVRERLGKHWPWHSCGGTVVVGVCKQWDDPLTIDPGSLFRIWHLPQLPPILCLVHLGSSVLGVSTVVLQRSLVEKRFCVSSLHTLSQSVAASQNSRTFYVSCPRHCAVDPWLCFMS